MTKFDHAMMDTALRWAELSHATRAKVGCVIAKDNRIIAHGYNGRPQYLLENRCEDDEGKTLPDVIHAEMNAVLFAAREGISLNYATAYITAEPCARCLPHLAVAGIKRIVYIDSYKSAVGNCSNEYYCNLGIQKVKYERYQSNTESY